MLLYIFWLLHQTTTSPRAGRVPGGCISFDSYIKPQLLSHKNTSKNCCISFDSYIKPQHYNQRIYYSYVVYLLTPTSNHNRRKQILWTKVLYIFWLLHQTTTWALNKRNLSRLYIFWLLHQTTTWALNKRNLSRLYIFWLLHQTTTKFAPSPEGFCCISFDSYIKPQLFLIWYVS